MKYEIKNNKIKETISDDHMDHFVWHFDDMKFENPKQTTISYFANISVRYRTESEMFSAFRRVKKWVSDNHPELLL